MSTLLAKLVQQTGELGHMQQDSSKHLTGIPLALSGIALGVATLLIVLDYSIANVSIPYISGALAVSADQGTYIITSFAVGNAIILPMTGWLTKRIGLVRLTLLSLVGFIIFSYTCAASFSLPMIVCARFLQGMASGPAIPASQSLIISIFPKEKKTLALTIWSTVMIVGPVLGPILGGWITYNYSWPWIFYINIPLGLFAILIIRLFLKPFETAIERPPTDWLGLTLLILAVSTLQFSLDKGEQFDWLRSPVIRICLGTSLICFTYLVAWEWLHNRPALELKLFKIKSFAISVVTFGCVASSYFGAVVLVPLWLQEYMGYTPFWAGIAIAPISLLPLLFSWTVHFLTKKISLIYLLALANIFFATACFATSHFFTTSVNIIYIALTRFHFGAGLTFFLVSVMGLSVQDIPQEKLPLATGLFHFMRAMSAGIGTAVFTTLWIRRSAFHHANIASTLLPTNLPANAYHKQLDALGLDAAEQMAVINDIVTQQAAILSLNDCFYIMGWIFILLIPIILIGKLRSKHDVPPSLAPHPPSPGH